MFEKIANFVQNNGLLVFVLLVFIVVFIIMVVKKRKTKKEIDERIRELQKQPMASFQKQIQTVHQPFQQFKPLNNPSEKDDTFDKLKAMSEGKYAKNKEYPTPNAIPPIHNFPQIPNSSKKLIEKEEEYVECVNKKWFIIIIIGILLVGVFVGFFGYGIITDSFKSNITATSNSTSSAIANCAEQKCDSICDPKINVTYSPLSNITLQCGCEAYCQEIMDAKNCTL